MQEYNRTMKYVESPQMPVNDFKGLSVTIFDGRRPPQNICLGRFQKNVITFGRGVDNDIVLSSAIVSGEHGRFCLKNGQWFIEDKAAYRGMGSTNGLIYHNRLIVSKTLSEGDFIRIDDGIETIADGVLFVFFSQESESRWFTFPLMGQPGITLGRAADCDIVLPHVSVSKVHGRIIREPSGYFIVDNGSTNGIVVNNRRVLGRQQLHEKDVIVITNTKLIFTSAAIFYCVCRSGISVDVMNVTITRGKGQKKLVTGNNISLHVKPGELVAIVGGSGAGKSTILNCMSGYLPPERGDVYINGVNLYQNFDFLKQMIGYVPQSDIVYDNLTLHDMLSYTAKLRLPKDITAEEQEEAIARAIRLVELKEKTNSMIKTFSGGQRKRASIAVELLSDPNLLFLDEPASGLDPGTERNLMGSLREMANHGKTIILVTHSTLQLSKCDRILFMGRGGELCFFGSCREALAFFGVPDVIDIYNLIGENSGAWAAKYRQMTAPVGQNRNAAEGLPSNKTKKRFQLPVLCARYARLVFNDRQRLLLLLLQAPLLALLISLVADGEQFKQYEMTKSLLFALSCAAFWVGMLNAIQEICKERNITRREYMTGLSLGSYLLSKLLVLGILCFIQSALIVGVFAAAVGLPGEGLLFPPLLELLVTTFLTAMAASATGLFVSSLFTNADRAMTVAPILLMPQILFSGLVFKLSGATEMISWFAVCRWSVESYGTTADLNSLPTRLEQQGFTALYEAEDFFEYTAGHMWKAWGMLLLFVIVFMALARVVLGASKKE